MFLQCSLAQIVGNYVLSILTTLIPTFSLLLHRKSKYGIPVWIADVIRILGIFNGLSGLIRSNLVEFGTLGWSAIWGFGFIAMVPFPTLYGYAFIKIGRKLYMEREKKFLMYAFIVLQTLYGLASIGYCIFVMLMPINENSTYLWILLIVFPGFAGLKAAFAYFIVPFHRHVKVANVVDVDVNLWKTVLWLCIPLTFPCAIGRLLYIASAFLPVTSCDALMIQTLGSMSTLVVEFLLYMDVPNTFLNQIHHIKPDLLLGKSPSAMQSKKQKTSKSSGDSTLKNSYFSKFSKRNSLKFNGSHDKEMEELHTELNSSQRQRELCEEKLIQVTEELNQLKMELNKHKESKLLQQEKLRVIRSKQHELDYLIKLYNDSYNQA